MPLAAVINEKSAAPAGRAFLSVHSGQKILGRCNPASVNKSKGYGIGIALCNLQQLFAFFDADSLSTGVGQLGAAQEENGLSEHYRLNRLHGGGLLELNLNY